MKKKKNPKKKIEKETRELKVYFRTNLKGSTDTKMSLPFSWFEHMGITSDDRDTEVTYHPRTKKITIRKKGSKTSKDDEE